MKTLRSLNPATGEVQATFESLSPEAIEEKIALSAAAFRSYRRTSFGERSAILNRAAGILEAEKERLGELMALEMGKLRQSGIEEAEKCARGCRYYAENAERFLADHPIEQAGRTSFVA
jgi:succinate-semialdehyde dehydrogenase/glutarate-semialdehyde dehydrogenase